MSADFSRDAFIVHNPGGSHFEFGSSEQCLDAVVNAVAGLAAG